MDFSILLIQKKAIPSGMITLSDIAWEILWGEQDEKKNGDGVCDSDRGDGNGSAIG
jgi:hypothetical protein